MIEPNQAVESAPVLELKPGHRPVVKSRSRRLLLAASLGLFIVFVFVGWRFYRHVAAAFFFAASNGSVSWRWTLDDGRRAPGTSVKLSSTYRNLSDGDLEHLRDLYTIRVLDCSRCTSVSAPGLAKVLPRLTDLMELHLSRTPPAYYRRRGYPYEESLLGPKITDAETTALKGLSQLEVLSLDGSEITDLGVANLLVLRRLEFLDLSFTKIADAGLAQLKELPRLRYLRLNGTSVSCEAVKALVQARPDLEVLLPRCDDDYDPKQHKDDEP
jgi:hypothetical protein